jgi:hypothetical protein
MHAIQNRNGVNVKVPIGAYEVSIVFSTKLEPSPAEVGGTYRQVDIRVFQGNSDITKELYSEPLTEEYQLLALMNHLARRAP